VNDAAALAQLMCELGYETTELEMQIRLERIANDDRYRTFVAVHDGNVYGMIGTLTSLSYEHNDLGGRILALVTLGTMWSRPDCNCGEGFRSKRNHAHRSKHTACPRRCTQVL